jgi:hypothetical protein
MADKQGKKAEGMGSRGLGIKIKAVVGENSS